MILLEFFYSGDTKKVSVTSDPNIHETFSNLLDEENAESFVNIFFLVNSRALIFLLGLFREENDISFNVCFGM
jgi:hypothetical protein